MGFIRIEYSIPDNRQLKIGYARVPQELEDTFVINTTTVENDLAFVYISDFIQSNESPYRIEGVLKGTYVVSLKMYKTDCDNCCDANVGECMGTQYFLVKSDSEDGGDNGDDNGDDDNNGGEKVIIKWGFYQTEPTHNSVLPYSVEITSGSNYSIDTTISTNLNWYMVREPMSEPLKTNWENTALNNGTIPDQVWQSPEKYNNFVYYKTRGKQAFQQSNKVKLYV